MKSCFYPILVVLGLLSANCNVSNSMAESPDTLPATALHPFGRFLMTDSLGVELISSSDHFGFSFEDTECRILATLSDPNAHNHLQYELDGTYQSRITISGQDSLPILITAPEAGLHTVWIYKATEAHTGSSAFFRTHAGQGV